MRDITPYTLEAIQEPVYKQASSKQSVIVGKEIELIKDGWDSFEPYGSGISLFRQWNFDKVTELDDVEWNGVYSKAELINGVLKTTYTGNANKLGRFFPQNQSIELDKKYIMRIKIRNPFWDVYLFSGSLEWIDAEGIGYKIPKSGEFIVHEIEVVGTNDRNRVEFYYDHSRFPQEINIGEFFEIAWLSLTPVDNQHLVVAKTPLENGLTRIQTWGGNHMIKLSTRAAQDAKKGDKQTRSLYLKNTPNSRVRFNQDGGTFDGNPQSVWDYGEEGLKEYTGVFSSDRRDSSVFVRGWELNDNLDFIASDPSIVYYDGSGETLSREIKQSELNLEGMLHKSNMRQLKLELIGKHDLHNQYLTFKREFGTLEDERHIINYGSFRVLEQSYNDDTKTTELIAYDDMAKAHTEFRKEDFNLTFPRTIGEVFKRVAEVIDLETDVTTFPLSDQIIEEDKWSATEYTYRDVLDHIAEATACTIGIRNNKLDICESTDTGVVIDYKRSKSMKIGEQVGKFNILNLTREPQHDNYAYPQDWTGIPIDDRKEYVLTNNQIVDKRREHYAPLLYNRIKDIEYHTFNAETFGWGIFDVGDIVTVRDLDGVEYKSIITSELNSMKGFWVTELVSEKLDTAKDKYVMSSDQRRQGQSTYLLVDQQNGIIKGVVDDVRENTSDIAQLVIEKDNILLSLENVQNEVDNIELTKVYNAYSANSDGVPFYETPRADTKYWGTASAINRPTLAGDYIWSLIQGAKGTDGTDGTDGENGKSVFMAYADLADGTGFSLTDDTKDWLGLYIGLPPQSTTPSDYNWSPSGYGNAKEITRVSLELDSVSGSVDILSTKVNGEVDKTAQLRLDVDSITTKVENMNENNNIIPNLNGNLESFQFWTFSNTKVKPFISKEPYRQFLNYSSNFEIKAFDFTLSQFGLSFYGQGKAKTGLGYVVPDAPYSFRGKRVNGSQVFSINVIEYGTDKKLIKTSKFDFNTPSLYESFTLDLSDTTQWVALEFIIPSTVNLNNRLELADMMFNRGNPKDWQESSGDVKLYAQSEIKQLDNQITSTVEEIKIVDGKTEQNKSNINQLSDTIELKVDKDGIISSINLSPEEAKIIAQHISLEGIVTANEYFKILLDGSATMNNAYVNGEVISTKGKIGGYTITENSLVGNDVTLGNRQIKIGPATLERATVGNEEALAIRSYYLELGDKSKEANWITVGGRKFVQGFTNGGYGVFARNIMPDEATTFSKEIGSSSNRWDNVYLKNQPNVSSDLRYKRLVSRINDDLLDVVKEIKPRTYYTIYDDKIHFGYIAQDVERALYKYALKTYDRQEALEVLDDFAMLSKDESYMSLLYGEIQVLKDAYYQRELDRQDEINKDLQEQINELKGVLNGI